ncbi:MAG: septum formation initiator family protein [Gammaproteobacteria bacterium]|jgi:cell division protein FtsB|nr:septum formation initiator family protein [Gammaproteobacteria bacterium]MBP6052260.1 septum formation initiator family protein [Pseudomonadales bacterium]MBK6581726.1 septum formation initiator family protein [Gammaproteobacteria bacterium]MBK7520561.1 septum formation initiator family protein [Gammaproteobacteria bacterium]MBK7728528.1 septum formation initiator family protein [Gammaproteobacteria bacterium]
MISWKWIALSLAVLLTVLQASLWIGQGSIAEVVALERQLGSMSATNEELRARNERLEVEVAEFRNGLDSVEEMAREELGMVRQGETFYVVVKH